MRVQLNGSRRVRPTQDGLEVVAPEHNIALELSDLAFRDELATILVGDAEIPVGNKAVEETLQQLENAGAISRQEETAQQDQSLAKGKETSWRIRRDLVGSRGPVTNVYWLDPSQSKLSLSQTHLFTAKYLERTGYGAETQEMWTSGSDADWEHAELKAIMEALERHACGVIPQKQLIKCTARKLGDRAIDPRRMVSYSERQYRNKLPFTPFSENQEYWWKSVKVLPDGHKKYLPVECLYYPVRREIAPGMYTTANSSGVAAGITFEDALLRALYEAIERDAFMITWLNRLTMPRIDQRTIPESCRGRVHSIESLGYRIYLIDITLEFIPVVLAVGMSETVKPSLALGAASNSDMNKAVEKAISEVEHQLYWEWRDPENRHSISNPLDVVEVLDHMALYASSEHLSRAEFLWGGEIRSTRVSPSNGDVWSTIERLKEHGIETTVLDLTPEYFKKAGVWILRAIPLGLVPISFGYGTEPLGMPRYRQFARLGTPWPQQVPFTHPFA